MLRSIERSILPHRQLRVLFDELLDQAGKTISLDELLVLVPRKLSAGMQLSTFTLFLREKSRYVAQKTSGEQGGAELSVAASCSTVSHLRRDRHTVVVDPEDPAGAWMMLATGEELAVLKEIQAQLLIPLQGRTGMAGFIAVSKGEGKKFSKYERRLLRSLGVQMGIGFETARFVLTLNEEAANRAKLAKELELAREVQERLLPQILHEIASLDVAAHYDSAERVGGDYYDAFVTKEGMNCYVVADVSGKGISAALLMATLRASLRSLLLHERYTAPVVLKYVNNLLYDASSASRYATLMLMMYEPGSNSLTYVNAGHNPPLLLHENEVIKLDCGGPVLGLLKDMEYEQGIVPFVEGDLIVAYTDGVTEALNVEGMEWGEERLVSLVIKHDATATATVRKVVDSLDSFTAGALQHDDLTLLVMRRSVT